MLFKLVNEDSEKLQKNFKISSQHPISGAFWRGFSDFWAPTEASRKPYFCSDFYKFPSESFKILLQRESKIFERPFTRVPKIRFPLPHSPHGSPKNLQKIFSTFCSAYIRCTRRRYPECKKRKRVHGEFCSESCGKFCGESCDGLRGASSVNLAAHPFSKTRLNLQATHKILPRKATTGQNARRCKYSLLGIQ